MSEINSDQKDDIIALLRSILIEGAKVGKSIESLPENSPLKNSYICSYRDLMCASIFGIRCVESISKEAFDSENNLILRLLGIELSLWTRKILENLIKSIIFQDYTEHELLLFIRCDALQFLSKNKNSFIEESLSRDESLDVKNIRSSILSATNLNKIIDIVDVRKIKNGDSSIIRPIVQQYPKSIELGNWHERFYLGDNYEIIYGTPSYQIHANIQLHERVYLKPKLLDDIKMLGHTQNLLLARLQQRFNINSGLGFGDESESENLYREMWMKEFEEGDIVVKKGTSEKFEVISKVDHPGSKYHFKYSVKKADGNSGIFSSIYLEKF